MAELTAEEHAAMVPPPPPEAGGKEDPMSSDDSNPDEEFWQSLSNEEDESAEEEVAAPPAEEPAVEEPSAPPEPEQRAEPIAESPPPVEPVVAPTPEPEAPAAPQVQEPQVNEEVAKQAAEKWQNDLAEHYSGLMQDEEFATRLIAEPQKVLPGLMAKATQVAMKNSFRMMQDVVPQMAQRMAQEVIQAELGKRAFFRKHPQLKGHEQAFEPFLASYRQMPQNARRTFEDVSGEAAVAFMVRNQIPTGAQAAPTPGTGAPPPPPPAATAPTAPSPQGNFWSSFADEIVEDDF